MLNSLASCKAGYKRLEETIYWVTLLIDSGIVKKEKLSGLCQEADELAAIFVASVKTVKRRT
jgi:four helix bundle protein